MIELERVTKRHGEVAAVDALSLVVPAGKITVLLGPSGCGKSTTLRMINRLIAADSGTIRIDGEDIAGLEPTALRRRIGYAIQGVGLFPHWSVARNVGAVPALLGWSPARIDARVDEMLRLVDLAPEVFGRKRPAELSGGQAQRVGVARALAADPAVLLMDEPFGALDPVTRRDLQAALRKIQRTTGKTVVFVTHDIDEALLLGDQIAVLRQGKLVQVGAPLEVLERPADDFIASFFGGAAAGLRRLSLVPARARAEAGDQPWVTLPAGASLRDALDLMLARGIDHVGVAEGGVVRLSGLLG
jgi:osmoprotectant transport system ATP-binding protein